MIKMKNLILLIFSLALLSCASLQHSLEKENKFYITLGDCFDNDTVSVYANDSLLFKDRVFESGFSTGKVPNTFIIYENGYLIAEQEGEQRKVKSQINDELRLEIYLNDLNSSFALSLKKGRIMVVDACQSEITINQYKKKVVFE